MRPPICAICHKDFRADLGKGGTVSFKPTESDKSYNEKIRKRRMVGHPPNLEWFCNKHLKIAEKYKHLNRSEAIPKILRSSNLWTRVIYLFKR